MSDEGKTERLVKEAWNAAIEAAAIKSYTLFDEKDFAKEVCANEIRKLKKP